MYIQTLQVDHIPYAGLFGKIRAKSCVLNMLLKLLHGSIYKYIAGSFHFFSGKYGNGENVKYYSMLKFDLIFPTSPPFVELYLAEFSTSVTRNDNNNIPVS